MWYESVDSTNNEAARLISSLDNLSVISALHQTAGRGQRGNTWNSDSGTNLMFSLVLKFGDRVLPVLPATLQFAISEATTLGIAEFLKRYGISARIKWPNDIYVYDRKICGILIENRIRNGLVSASIVGIGLNLNQETFPDNLPNPTSVFLESGKVSDIRKSLEYLLDDIGKYLDILVSEGYADALRVPYLKKMYRKDAVHLYIDNLDGHEFEGIIRGISDNGCLVVETSDGFVREFAFKEISYVIS